MTMVDYNREFWCTYGGHKLKRGQEKHDRKGHPICPQCGRRVRFTARNKNEPGNR